MGPVLSQTALKMGNSRRHAVSFFKCRLISACFSLLFSAVNLSFFLFLFCPEFMVIICGRVSSIEPPWMEAPY